MGESQRPSRDVKITTCGIMGSTIGDDLTRRRPAMTVTEPPADEPALVTVAPATKMDPSELRTELNSSIR